MWSPGAKGRILKENTDVFVRFSTGLHCKNHPEIVGGIPVSGGLAAIFPGLEPARLRYLAHFAGKGPGYASLKSGHPTSVHRRGIGLASRGIYPQYMPLILLPP
jgi:hypothetical protein